VLAKIGRLAEKYRCTFVFIAHPPKMQMKALYSSLGSIDLPAAARSILVVGSNPENPEQRIVASAKSSLATAGKSIAFHISDGGVVWESYSDLTADEIIGGFIKDGTRNKPSVKLENAAAWLEDFMGTAPYIDASKINRAAIEAGISSATLNRAKNQLGILGKQIGKKGQGATYWFYPENADKLPAVVEQCTIDGIEPP